MIWLTLFVLGLVVATLGIALDYLLPASSPGLNLPQLLIVAAGIGLSSIAALLRHESLRKRFFDSFKRNIARGLIIALATLLAIEIVLTALDLPTYYPRELPYDSYIQDFQGISWVMCDEEGCRLNYERITAACAAGELRGRYCVVNRQGYPNEEDFHWRSELEEQFRIITLGDSFTQGSTADIGKSYVERLKAETPAAEIWNLAIASTGTKQAIQAYDQIAPLFRPQLTIHGFCMNDFTDNLLLNYADLQLRNAEGNIMFFPRYPQAWRDRWGRPIQLPQKLVIRYAIAGYPPPLSDLEARLGVTQLGTMALRLLDRAASAVYNRADEEVEKTRQYLAQLRDSIMATDSHYLVLLIPEPVDIRDPNARVANAIKLLEDLGIPYLNPISLLNEADYVPHPDNHWNNAGHQKIGALLSDCVQRFINTGQLAECENVTMPGRAG